MISSLSVFLFFAFPAKASIPLTYGNRTKNFSAWTPAIRGDINTIGMGGATLAIPSSIAAAEANSAGFAMATQSISAQINKTSYEDKRIQLSNDSISTYQWGLGVSPPPWGFGIAYYSPMTESGAYNSLNTGHVVDTEVSIKEYRFTLARAFLQDTLAIGVSLEVVKAVRDVADFDYNKLGLSYRLGALYRLPYHVILGATFAPEMEISPVQDPIFQNEIPEFNRSVIRPSQIGMGLGWFPNRFFKFGLSLSRIGTTKNTALLANQNIGTGAKPTLVPRIGASYILMEYQNYKAEWAVGSYYEMSRLEGHPSRLHVTTGFELNPYFINLGAGFDLARDYKNVMISAGVDIVRTLRTFDIIPKDPVPPYNGFFPKPIEVSADGMPEGMTKGEVKKYEAPSVEDVGKIIRDIPKRVDAKISGKKIPEDKPKSGKNSGNIQIKTE